MKLEGTPMETRSKLHTTNGTSLIIYAADTYRKLEKSDGDWRRNRENRLSFRVRGVLTRSTSANHLPVHHMLCSV